MASATLAFSVILSFAVPLLTTSHSFHHHLTEDHEEETYILDVPFVHDAGLSPRRFLATVRQIKKGAKCDSSLGKKNICNGVLANSGTSLLNCCKRHCRNVYGDRNNCGACGRKCAFGQRCCNGKCTDILRNDENCGKCGKKCKTGNCQHGVCGYA